MNPAAPSHRRKWIAAAIFGLGGLGVSWLLTARSVEPAPQPRLTSVASRGSPAAPPGARELQPRADTQLSNVSSVSLRAAAPEPHVHDDELPDELRVPHPITPQHRRIFEENTRIGEMNAAMDGGDFEALRRMNAEYRRDYPEDEHVLQTGYDLIADCLEERTDQAIDAARRFWRAERASSLRRHVRRHCLSGEAPR